MSFMINIKSDLNKIERTLDNMEKKQLPYAVSLTLNELALISQNKICNHIKRAFNNRINWWSRRQRTGIKVEFSNKHNLISAVYTKAHFAHIQEVGGTKLPYRSSKLAVPTAAVSQLQRSSKALRNLSNRNNVFRIGNSIYQRKGKGQLERLYSLTPQAKIKPALKFRETVERTVDRELDRVFTRCFNRALDTANR